MTREFSNLFAGPGDRVPGASSCTCPSTAERITFALNGADAAPCPLHQPQAFRAGEVATERAEAEEARDRSTAAYEDMEAREAARVEALAQAETDAAEAEAVAQLDPEAALGRHLVADIGARRDPRLAGLAALLGSPNPDNPEGPSAA